MTKTGTDTTATTHRTVPERAEAGKGARAKVPRTSMAEWSPAKDRPDPIALLEEQAVTRVPELVPIRHGRMAASPFAFYRGAALVMASDLASSPHSGLDVQLCGDAHLANFGAFASPERSLVFDLNDFDETLPGPFEWDVKRLVASFEIAGRSRGFEASVTADAVTTVGRSYREAIRGFAEMRNLDVWYSRLDAAGITERLKEQVSTKESKLVSKAAVKAESKDRLKAFAKLTVLVDGEPRIISEPPLIVPVEELFADQAAGFEDVIRKALRDYRHTLQSDRRHLLDTYRYVHLARKVVGVGSVGTRAWIVLMLGRDGEDPLFLQVKEAEASVLERFLRPSGFSQHGQRVVEGQRLVQAASDIFLGWDQVVGVDGKARDFYFRQLWDWKASANLDAMPASLFRVYAEACGSTLARAHARSGDRIALAGYLGASDRFERSLAKFARAYADQNTKDHAALVKAIETGRVQAQSGI